MIEIFIPKRIKNYYVLPQRILGFDINKTAVHAAQILCSGAQIVIEKLMHEPIDTDASRSYNERVAQAISALVKRADRPDIIRTSLNSSAIVFKEVTFPFTDSDKIKMVTPFEIEASLPFNLSQAVVDVLITQAQIEEKKATVLAAAAQKTSVQEQLAYFEAAGVPVQAVTIDVFDLYGFYSMIPESDAPGSVVLIDIGYYMTRILLLIDGKLKLVRTVPKGVITIAKNLGNLLSLTTSQSLEEFIRFGFEKHDGPDYYKAVSQACSDFWQTVQFTLQSFGTGIPSGKIDRVLMLGSGSEIAGMRQYAANFLQLDVVVFDPQTILKNKSITIRQGQRIEQSSILSLATAFSTALTSEINLRQGELEVPTTMQFAQQLITAIVLAALIIGSLFGYTWWQKRKITKSVMSSEREMVTVINNLQLSDSRTLDEALADAERKVNREEELWFAFSRQTRFSFLKALQDLSSAIDRQGVGLKLRRLVITPNYLTLEGEVKDFNGLKVLERELRDSNMFILVPALQELKINEKLFFKKNGAQE
ncbi:MAG: Competence protein A [Candidatus Dependentiae bacterium ADurb.Bin331]|nr:MAG: Competence protein A [Candidatus Dependentiae bacterium ADurb.Bin331]